MAEETKINNNDAENCPASDRDILENEIVKLGEGLIDILLADRSSGKNIIWATDSYVSKGAGFGVRDTMTVSTVTDANGLVIQPRVDKSAEEQRARSVDKAEVISWNIWQMDGLKYVVPYSCHPVSIPPAPQLELFFDDETPPPQLPEDCPGCRRNKPGDPTDHNGDRCRIMDWEIGKPVLFMPPFEFKPIETNSEISGGRNDIA